MNYSFLDNNQRKLAISLALVGAWMWSLPLFGVLQPPAVPSGAPEFSLLFLMGTTIGFIIMSHQRMLMWLPTLALHGVMTNILLTIILMLTPNLPTMRAFVPAIAFLMGAASTPLLIVWGYCVFHTKLRQRGRYVGIMLLLASLMYAIILISTTYSPLAAHIIAASLLIAVYFLVTGTIITNTIEHKSNGQISPILFWIVITLLLASYYSLSWISHQFVLSAAREVVTITPIIGAVVYGIIAFIAGIIYDETGEIEGIAMVGLALLLSAFMFVPRGISNWVPILLEASYGILDLFVFAYLAIATAIVGGLPQRVYAVGLSINAAVVASGYLWGFVYLPTDHTIITVSALVLVLGTISALILRTMRTTGPNKRQSIDEDAFTFESLTNRERDVLELIMQGRDNKSIAQDLQITNNTVKTHVRNIYAKAGVSSRADLILKVNRWAADSARAEVRANLSQDK